MIRGMSEPIREHIFSTPYHLVIRTRTGEAIARAGEDVSFVMIAGDNVGYAQALRVLADCIDATMVKT